MQYNVLVVDAEPSIRSLVGNFLTSHGFQVTCAANSVDALQTVHESPLHLVVLDVNLEETGGVELMQVIQNSHPNLPVLLLSGMGFTELAMHQTREKGASGYISKLLLLNRLLLEVRRAVSKYQREAIFSY